MSILCNSDVGRTLFSSSEGQMNKRIGDVRDNDSYSNGFGVPGSGFITNSLNN